MRISHRKTCIRAVAATALAVLLVPGCAASGYDPGREPTPTDDSYLPTPEPEPTDDFYTPTPDPTDDFNRPTPDPTDDYYTPTPEPTDDAAALLAEADGICASVFDEYFRYKSGSAGSDPVAMGVAAAQLMADAAAQLKASGDGELYPLAQRIQERAALTGQANAAMDAGSYERYTEANAALEENSALLLDEATALGLESCAELAGL